MANKREDLGALLKLVRDKKSIREARQGRPKPLVEGGKAWKKREKAKQDSIDAALEKIHRRAVSQAKYHAKNREELNRNRALRGRSPVAMYRRTVGKAREKKIPWEFTFETWQDMWEGAPRVYDEKRGYYATAWSLKGCNYNVNTQMNRKDIKGPWSPDNCHISFRGEPLMTEEELDNATI